MANDKDDTYNDNKIKNDSELLGNKTTPPEELQPGKNENGPKPGQLFSEFIRGQGGREDIEKTGTSFEMPESKKVKTTWADKIKNDREHE